MLLSASQLQCSEAELIAMYIHTEGLQACYLVGFSCKKYCIVENLAGIRVGKMACNQLQINVEVDNPMHASSDAV